MINLKSKKYSNINYEKGKEVWYDKGQVELPFFLYIDSVVTEDLSKVELAKDFIDNVDKYIEQAIDFLKDIVHSENDEYYYLLKHFLDFHLDEEVFDSADITEMFGTYEYEELDLSEAIDQLTVKQVSSHYDDTLNQQLFLIDFSFNSDFTDEILAVYFNSDINIINLAHEN
ncbi:MAG: hypothetical protein ACK5LV_07235 [Lachnospirales bacterium]